MKSSQIAKIILLTVLTTISLSMDIILIISNKTLGAALFSALTICFIWGIDDTVNDYKKLNQ